ncbi:hypothetical protein Tco_0615026 [Tanacetum coccineum]
MLFLHQKNRFVTTRGYEFLFSPLLEEYYNPTHGSQLRKTTMIKHRMQSFHQDDFFQSFCTLGIKKFVMITDGPKIHPLEQVSWKSTIAVQIKTTAATDPEMCMFALLVSIVEPKNIKEAMADSAWIEAMQEELHQFRTD